MRLARKIVITQRARQENEVIAAGRFATRRPGYNHSDFEYIVLHIARAIEPDTEKLMAWYRGTPIMSIDALTAEKLVHLGRGNEVIAFLDCIRTGVTR